MEVELSKRSVKDLKSILREHKKIHCKPYSKLNKSQLIELIMFFNLLETDMTKLLDKVPISKPKAKKPTKPKSPKLKSETKRISKTSNNVNIMIKKVQKTKPTKSNPEKKTNDYIERIHKKYPSSNLQNLKQADLWIREKFIDSGFASKFAFAKGDNISVPTKKSLRSNPYGSVGKKQAQDLRSSQEDARTIVNRIYPTFNKAMTNGVMVEIFSNIIVDNYLIDILEFDKVFRAVFSMTYGLKSINIETPKQRQEIMELVTQDQNNE